uniref:Cathepsin propeptide inhibitor domain-containing protein n=1 Tax=Oryza punctata TaxID=4537 RepID=A0A0E0MLC2_ORYPU
MIPGDHSPEPTELSPIALTLKLQYCFVDDPDTCFAHDEKDLESDEAVWALYERWCSFHSVEPDHDDMVRRFGYFKDTAHRIIEFNKSGKSYLYLGDSTYLLCDDTQKDTQHRYTLAEAHAALADSLVSISASLHLAIALSSGRKDVDVAAVAAASPSHSLSYINFAPSSGSKLGCTTTTATILPTPTPYTPSRSSQEVREEVGIPELEEDDTIVKEELGVEWSCGEV